LVYPIAQGILVENPYDTLAPLGGWMGWSSPGAGDWNFSSDYPGSQSLQILSFYEEGRGGFYLTTLDSQNKSKGYMFFRIKDQNMDSIIISLLMIPDVFEYGNTINQTYPFRIGVFDGDWQDAAEIYRNWATNQWWTAKGLVDERKDIPNWWKQTELVFLIGSYDDKGNLHIPISKAKKAIAYISHMSETHFAVHWRGGFHIVRPSELTEMTKFAKLHNASF
jgi:hypothetical protein